MLNRRSFTLIEIIIVVIIIGILAGIALPNFGPLKEQTLDREAQVNLRLIIAAERIYRMENSNNQYYESQGSWETYTQDINNNLRLSLPTSVNRNWSYRTHRRNDGALGERCCVMARRNSTPVRTWSLLSYEDEPSSGNCGSY